MNIGNDKKEFNNIKASLRREPKPVNIYSPTNTNLVKRKPKPPNGKLSDKWEKHFRRNVIDETTLKPTWFVDDNNISNMRLIYSLITCSESYILHLLLIIVMYSSVKLKLLVDIGS